VNPPPTQPPSRRLPRGSRPASSRRLLAAPPLRCHDAGRSHPRPGLVTPRGGRGRPRAGACSCSEVAGPLRAPTPCPSSRPRVMMRAAHPRRRRLVTSFLLPPGWPRAGASTSDEVAGPLRAPRSPAPCPASHRLRRCGRPIAGDSPRLVRPIVAGMDHGPAPECLRATGPLRAPTPCPSSRPRVMMRAVRSRLGESPRTRRGPHRRPGAATGRRLLTTGRPARSMCRDRRPLASTPRRCHDAGRSRPP
jgi:hypothetical protein